MRTLTRAQRCAMFAMDRTGDTRHANHAMPGDYLLAIAGLEPNAIQARDDALRRARVSDITAAYPGTGIIEEFGGRCVI